MINLTGAPAVGKSLFSGRFILEHSWFNLFDIASYRIEYWEENRKPLDNEKVCWEHFENDILFSKNCLIETSGLSYQLPTIIKKAGDSPILTIYFYGDRKVIKERLRNRQRIRPLPPQYREEDEMEMVDRVTNYFDYRDYPGDIFSIDVTEKGTDEVYEIVKDRILEKRIGIIR